MIVCLFIYSSYDFFSSDICGVEFVVEVLGFIGTCLNTFRIIPLFNL